MKILTRFNFGNEGKIIVKIYNYVLYILIVKILFKFKLIFFLNKIRENLIKIEEKIIKQMFFIVIHNIFVPNLRQKYNFYTIIS